MSLTRILAAAVTSAFAVTVASCAFWQQPKATIPMQTMAAQVSGNPKRMVIVLPGYGDNLAGLEKSGIAATVQRNMPDAEVVLVELSLPYYMEGRGVQRLHDEVVQPAKQRGVRDIYLAGASMGGMGVLLYEREYPNEMRGLILMAPFMGDAAIMKEIEAAGGLKQWNPGPTPEQMNRNNTSREEWRVVQSWIAHRDRAREVWLISGQSDRLHPAAEMIAPLLPPQNYLSLPGGHAWKVWTQGAEKAFAAIGKVNATREP